MKHFQTGNKTIGFMTLALLPVIFALSCSSTQARDYNLVMISLDTTRYDFVDTGKGARAHTPFLKQFARRSIVFDNAFCTIPQTLPSHLSAFSARYPNECGVPSNENEYVGSQKMIQEILQERGWHTTGIISLGTLSSKTGIQRGFDEYIEDLYKPNTFFATGESVSKTAVSLLDRLKGKKFFLFAHFSDPHSPYAPPDTRAGFDIDLNGKPLASFNAYEGILFKKKIQLKTGWHTLTFSHNIPKEDYVFFIIRRLKFSSNCRVSISNLEYSEKHYKGSHLLKTPRAQVKIYCRGQGQMELFQVIPILTKQAAIRYYGREIEYMDRQVGSLLDALKTKKLLKHTVVVIFGDHGEGLGERNQYFGHVRYLNKQFIHVPLIMHLPGIAPRRIKPPVSLIDLSPTVLDFMRIDFPDLRKTATLMPLIKHPERKWDRAVLSFAFEPSAVTNKFSVIKWPYQTIYLPKNSVKSSKEFYNLLLSPSFSGFDQLNQHLVIINSFQHYRYLLTCIRDNKSVFTKKFIQPNLSEREYEKLRSLGYLD